jgi:hypothetical protein
MLLYLWLEGNLTQPLLLRATCSLSWRAGPHVWCIARASQTCSRKCLPKKTWKQGGCTLRPLLQGGACCNNTPPLLHRAVLAPDTVVTMTMIWPAAGPVHNPGPAEHFRGAVAPSLRVPLLCRRCACGQGRTADCCSCRLRHQLGPHLSSSLFRLCAAGHSVITAGEVAGACQGAGQRAGACQEACQAAAYLGGAASAQQHHSTTLSSERRHAACHSTCRDSYNVDEDGQQQAKHWSARMSTPGTADSTVCAATIAHHA